MKKHLTILTCSLLLFLTSQAQTLTPSWEVSLPGKVKWMQINDWGIVIASCETGLYGIDPRDGNKIWEVTALTNVPEENYSTIPGTPLVVLAERSGNAKVAIINGLTGQKIFNSNESGIEKVQSKRVISEIEGVMISYSNEAGDGVALYSYTDGTEVWNTSIEKAKGNALQAQPIVDDQGNILYTNGSILYKIEGASGSILWQVETKKNFIDLFTNPSKTIVYGVSGSASEIFSQANAEPSVISMSSGGGKFLIEAFNIDNGNEEWKNPIEYKSSKYGGVALGEQDFFLLHTLSANKIKYDSGEPVWKKEKLGTGGADIGGIYGTDEGMIYVAPDSNGRTYVNYVDAEGKSIWKKKSIIVGQMIMMEDHGDAFFYITSKGPNFLSKEDGKVLWEGDKYLSGSVPVSFVRDVDDTYVMYVEGKLIRINLESRDWAEIASGFGFQAELPSDLQQIEEGFVLSGNQNAMLISKNGETVYHQYYPAPEQSFAARMALGALSTASAVGSMAYGMSSLGYGLSGAVQGNEAFMKKANQQATIASFTGEMSGGFDALASARFGEQASTDDYKLILTKQDKNIGFVKINLSNGDEEGMIVTADRTPDFVIDGIDDKLFLKLADNRVACYQL